jgi:hypothetical protein
MTESISLHTLAKVPFTALLGAVADDAAEEAEDAADEIAEDAEEAIEEADEVTSDVFELPHAVILSAIAAAAQAVRTVFPPTVMVIPFRRLTGS